jgi:Cytochrome c554 and c-prime
MKRPAVGLSSSFALLAIAVAASIAPLACSSSSGAAASKPSLTPEQLRDPSTCGACHISHYQDWSQSMHAYASEDPVFLAMNALGQSQTNGKLGTFCVQCHAPVAVKDGLTTNGLNLASLAPYERNITCFFCHSIDTVGQSHVNADVHLATDGVFRGEIHDPQANTAHASAYSALQDHTQPESAAMCGTCHDIVSPAGGHIERTFAEWQQSAVGTMSNETCGFTGTCHMSSSPIEGPVALNGPTNRTFHSHDFPAVDIAFNSSFPDPATQEAKVEAVLGNTLQGALCVNSLGGIRVFLDNVGAGHAWPSGAAQDRRAWAEVVASKGGQQIYSSGSVAPGTVVGSDPTDKDIWILRDVMFDAQNNPVDMFWQAACSGGNELQAISTFDETQTGFFTHQERYYPHTANPGDSYLSQMPDDVTLKIHLQPIGLDVLNDLVQQTKDLDGGAALDPNIVAQMPTLDVALKNEAPDGGTQGYLEWTTATATGSFPDATEGPGVMMSCVSTLNFNVTSDSHIATNPPTTCPMQ